MDRGFTVVVSRYKISMMVHTTMSPITHVITNTSLRPLSLAYHIYLCSYSIWGGGSIMWFILLTGSCCCLTKKYCTSKTWQCLTLCVCVCVCFFFFFFFFPVIHSQQLFFLLFSYLDIPSLPHPKTLSPNHISTQITLGNSCVLFLPLPNLGQKVRESH
jgi:hypothetical protein